MYLSLERGEGEREKEGEKHGCVGETSFGWESNWRPFSFHGYTQPTEPHQSGQNVSKLFEGGVPSVFLSRCIITT